MLSIQHPCERLYNQQYKLIVIINLELKYSIKVGIKKPIAGWCNGSTRGSGPRSPGSNPGPAATNQKPGDQISQIKVNS